MNSWDFLQEDGMTLAKAVRHASPDDKSFEDWCTTLLEAHHVKKCDAIRRAQINPTFAYQILAGQRNGKRDKLIQLAFGIGLDVELTSEFIERGGTCALSTRSTRDVAIAFCRARNMSVAECDETLYRAGLAPLRNDYPNVRGWW